MQQTFAILTIFMATCAAATAQPLQHNDREHLDENLERLRSTWGINLLEAAGWSLTHAVEDEHTVSNTLGHVATLIKIAKEPKSDWQSNYLSSVKDLQSLAKSTNGIVRGVGMIALGIIRETPVDLARSEITNLPRKRLTYQDMELGFAARNAAMSLGLGEVTNAIPLLANNLDHPNDMLREGIIFALVELQATNSAPRILPLIDDFHSSASAISALVSFQATNSAPTIAQLLGPELGGDSSAAIVGLALLGAKEYAPTIASFLEENSGSQIQAILSLGLLQSTIHEPKIRHLLTDSNDRVREAAAYSLMLMESKEHDSQIRKELNTLHSKIGRFYELLDFTVCPRTSLRLNERLEHVGLRD